MEAPALRTQTRPSRVRTVSLSRSVTPCRHFVVSYPPARHAAATATNQADRPPKAVFSFPADAILPRCSYYARPADASPRGSLMLDATSDALGVRTDRASSSAIGGGGGTVFALRGAGARELLIVADTADDAQARRAPPRAAVISLAWRLSPTDISPLSLPPLRGKDPRRRTGVARRRQRAGLGAATGIRERVRRRVHRQGLRQHVYVT